MSWAIEEKGYSQRRACRLIGLEPKTYHYASTRGDDAAVRVRLRSLAGERRRFGYPLHLGRIGKKSRSEAKPWLDIGPAISRGRARFRSPGWLRVEADYPPAVSRLPSARSLDRAFPSRYPLHPARSAGAGFFIRRPLTCFFLPEAYALRRSRCLVSLLLRRMNWSNYEAHPTTLWARSARTS